MAETDDFILTVYIDFIKVAEPQNFTYTCILSKHLIYCSQLHYNLDNYYYCAHSIQNLHWWNNSFPIIIMIYIYINMYVICKYSCISYSCSCVCNCPKLFPLNLHNYYSYYLLSHWHVSNVVGQIQGVYIN